MQTEVAACTAESNWTVTHITTMIFDFSLCTSFGSSTTGWTSSNLSAYTALTSVSIIFPATDTSFT